MTTETLVKKVTPAAAFRAMSSPYRDKLERSDAARGKLEGRLRRAFEMCEAEMKEIWGGDPADGQPTETNGAP